MARLADARDILRSVVASFFGFGGRLIARAFLMVVAGRAMGLEQLGALGQAAAITEIAAAIGVMGLRRSLLDLLSFDAERGQRPEARIVEAMIAALFFSVIISTCLIPMWKIVLPGEPRLASMLFIVAPAIVFTEIALTAIRYKRIIFWDILVRSAVEPWTILGLTLLSLNFSGPAHRLIWAYGGSLLIAAVVASIGLGRVYGARALLTSKPSLSRAASIPAISAPAGITDIGVMALRRMDVIILGLAAAPATVGLYYMVQQLASIPQKVYGLFEPMMSPVIARLHNRMDVPQIRKKLIDVCRWVLIIQLAMSVPMVVYGDRLLSIFGPGFAAGAVALAIILAAELIDGAFLATETPLVFVKPAIPPSLLAAAIIIEAISVALLARHWGAAGAATGFLLCISMLTIGRLVMLKKYLDITVITTDYIAPILISAAILIGLLTLQTGAGPHPLLQTIVGFVGSVALFLGLIRACALTPSDRVLFRHLMKKRRKYAR
jgi:O-antigen/teichoic acid export membrane protein